MKILLSIAAMLAVMPITGAVSSGGQCTDPNACICVHYVARVGQEKICLA